MNSTPKMLQISDLPGHVGEPVTLRGWVEKFRSSGKIAFVVLRDGTGTVQVVCARNDLDEASWEAVGGLDYEASVRVTGDVKADDRAPSGVEVTARELEVIGPSTD
jgi:asparaginyl-tRNA synthetase